MDTTVDVARVDIVGDKGVIGEGTAIIESIPDNPIGTNPVVGQSVGGGIIDAGGSMGFDAPTISDQVFIGGKTVIALTRPCNIMQIFIMKTCPCNEHPTFI